MTIHVVQNPREKKLMQIKPILAD